MIYILFIIAVTCCILSQTPYILKSDYDLAFKLMWILPFIYLILLNGKSFMDKKLINFYLFIITFFLYCTICESITGTKYIGIDLYNIALSFFTVATSYNFWKNYMNKDFLTVLAIFLIISSLILSYAIYLTSFSDGLDLYGRSYAFEQKNSMGQILLFIIIIFYFIIKSEKKTIKVLKVIAILIPTVMIFLIKARATILGFIFVGLYYLFTSKNIKHKILHISLLVLITFFILSNAQNYDLFVNSILLGGRSYTDFNDLSSDRIYILKNILPSFSGHELFGAGNLYYDSFPIAMIIQYGIIGSLIVFVFLIRLGYYIVRKRESLYRINNITFLLFSITIINSFFEAQPPFGPGAKCFLFWMFLGFSLATDIKKIK